LECPFSEVSLHSY